jgi:FkbM family methyltransferase
MPQVVKFILQHPLNQGRTLSALMRFLIWQFSSRIWPKPRAISFVDGTRLWMRKGWTGVNGNLYTGLHEFEDMAFLLHFLGEEDVFADVGANMGSYTVLASGVCGARTYAFEPVPVTFDRLKKNVALNNIEDKVNCINAAVGEIESTIAFTSQQDTTNHIATSEDTESVQVPLITLDGIFIDSCPALIKMDVEGYEHPAIQGAKKILANPVCKAIIIELNGSGGRYGFDENEIHQQLLSYGFRPYKYQPFLRQLEPISTFGTHNTVYIRNVGEVSKKIQQAPLRKIHHSTL